MHTTLMCGGIIECQFVLFFFSLASFAMHIQLNTAMDTRTCIYTLMRIAITSRSIATYNAEQRYSLQYI